MNAKVEVIQEQLREILLPVFGLENVDEVEVKASLVEDLGADSIDFVEIIYEIEQNFGVTLKTREIFIGGKTINPEELFVDGKIPEEKVAELHKDNPETKERIQAGMTPADLFSQITVQDLAQVIAAKMLAKNSGDAHAEK
jgi:acyl carrier protein